MAKIPKLGRVIAREQGVKDPEAVFLDVEWVDDEGYRVVGEFELIGWKRRRARSARRCRPRSVSRRRFCTTLARAVEQVPVNGSSPEGGTRWPY